MEEIKKTRPMCRGCNQLEECQAQLSRRKHIIYDKVANNCFLFETHKDVIEFTKTFEGDTDGVQKLEEAHPTISLQKQQRRRVCKRAKKSK